MKGWLNSDCLPSVYKWQNTEPNKGIGLFLNVKRILLKFTRKTSSLLTARFGRKSPSVLHGTHLVNGRVFVPLIRGVMVGGRPCACPFFRAIPSTDSAPTKTTNQPSKRVNLPVKFGVFGRFWTCVYSTEWHKHWGLAGFAVKIFWNTVKMVRPTRRALHSTCFMTGKTLF